MSIDWAYWLRQMEAERRYDLEHPRTAMERALIALSNRQEKTCLGCGSATQPCCGH